MDADVTRHRWSEEDVAYAAAQWASGIKQRDIARVFGHATPSAISTKITEFILKQTDVSEARDDFYRYLARTGTDRRELVKDALARFVEARKWTTGALT